MIGVALRSRELTKRGKRGKCQILRFGTNFKGHSSRKELLEAWESLKLVKESVRIL